MDAPRIYVALRAWRFIEQDLMVHMRSQYHTSNEIVQHHDYRRNKGWQSKREVSSGGLGGWSNFNTVLRYAHLSSNHLQQAAERICAPLA